MSAAARGALAAAGLACALALAGCGDPALWARWQSDAAIFRAQELERRVEARGTSAIDADWARVAAHYRSIVERYPASAWASPAPPHGPARDVAATSARAMQALGAIAARRGHDDEAAETWRHLETEYASLPVSVVTARVSRIGALGRLGRFDEALAERAALAETDPLGDPGRTSVPSDVLDAPVLLARELGELGRDDEASAALARGESLLAAALERARGTEIVDLADALSRTRAARGDGPGALAALRRALPAMKPWDAPLLAQVAAQRALDAGAPESVFAYARWAVRSSDARPIAGQAWLSAARAWELLGQPDSALAQYDAVLTRWTDPGALGPPTRYQRARLLESMGRWELAHAEYLALAAKYPTHALAFQSSEHIVRHRLEHGEDELARIEGTDVIENLEHLLATNRDPDVQRLAGGVRAELLMAIGRLDEAETALLGQWARFPADSAAQAGALRAAQLARHRPGGANRADSILALLRRGAFSATVRRAAAEGAAGER